jgi:hypothetical protein
MTAQVDSLLSPNSAFLDEAFENEYDGKAISSISTSRCRLECANCPSISLKIKRPVSACSQQESPFL